MGAKTAPPGYPTNTAAIYHLIRQGPAVLSKERFLVLLFHIERATSYGKAADQHSQGQAMEGTYSHRIERRTGGAGAWVRGRAGVSLAQYKRENAALLKAGLLQTIRRKGKNDADTATEYLPNWLGIRAALEAHELERPAPTPKPLFQSPPGSARATPLALPEPPPWLCQSHTVVEVNSLEFTVSESRARDPGSPTHSLSNEGQGQTSASEIRALIESLYGRELQPNDAIPGQILAIAQRVGVPLYPLCLFLQETAARWKTDHYPVTSPRLYVRATAQDLIKWAKQNAALINSAQREEALEQTRQSYSAGKLAELPAAAAPLLQCPDCQGDLIHGTCHAEACIANRTRLHRATGRA